ncbi:MAG: hypothetical protein C0467_05210 [Planctomycetaceae bacterium]|nr:hypothetical protein [Planctomycetaceae bacterium]
MAAVALALLLGTAVSLFFGLHAQRIADDETKARKSAEEQRKVAELATAAKEAETREKEKQRLEAVAATRARDAEIVKFRNALLDAQLLHVNQIWERDPVEAMRMLHDEAVCPPEIRDFTWKLFEQLVPRERASWKNHTGNVVSLASSPNGRMLGSCGADGIKVRDIETGQLITSINEPAERIAFAPSGTVLVSTQGRRLLFWHVPSGKFAYALNAHDARIRAVTFDQMGNLLATSSLDKTVKVWDPNLGKLQQTLPGHDGEHGAIGFGIAANGKAETLTVSDRRLGIKKWNLATKEATTWKGFDDGGYVATLSPDGKTLAFGDTQFGSGEVGRMELRPSDPAEPTKQQISRRQSYLGHSRPLRAFAFSADSKLLASLDSGGIVKLWDTKREIDDWQKDAEYVTLTDSGTSASAIVFSASHQRRWFATGGVDGGVKVWHLEPQKPRGLESKLLGWYFALAISPDSKTVAAANTDSSGNGAGQIQLWDRATGERGKVFKAHIGHVWSLAFSPDGNTLASCAGDGKVILTDVTTGSPRFTLTDKPGPVRCVAFNRDRSLLASAHEDGNVRVWDVAKGQLRATLSGHVRSVFGVAFHPDGRTLASAGDDKTVRVWDVVEKRQRASIEGHTQAVWCVSFSPDGHTLASASVDKSIKFWDLEEASLKHRVTLTGHHSRIWSMTFSPDGKTLASGSGEGFAGCEVRLWDVLNGRPRGKLVSHSFEVRAVAFSPDGETLATSGFETLVYLWETTRRQPVPVVTPRPGQQP